MSEEEMLKDIEIVCRNISRSDYLIAIFHDGYASGWTFAVKEAFRPALDIRLTDKIIDKKKHKVWTQGQAFDFHEGDVFHNNILAYKDWDLFLRKKNPISLQIVSTSSSGMVDDETIKVEVSPVTITKITKTKSGSSNINSLTIKKQKYNHGTVVFDILKPSQETKKMVKKFSLKLKQSEFVTLLQTGMYYDNNYNKFISLKFEDRNEQD